MVKAFIPDAGDIVWLELDPQVGNEQAGHRPALVLSPASYNSKVGLMLCCPMTTKIKGYPFEVVINSDSAVLSDQIKSLDWRKRHVIKKGIVSGEKLTEVRAKVKALIG